MDCLVVMVALPFAVSRGLRKMGEMVVESKMVVHNSWVHTSMELATKIQLVDINRASVASVASDTVVVVPAKKDIEN